MSAAKSYNGTSLQAICNNMNVKCKFLVFLSGYTLAVSVALGWRNLSFTPHTSTPPSFS